MIENEDNLPADDPHDADRSRIAKVIARAGLASRRDAEAWIAEGRVSLNGKKVDSPAVQCRPARQDNRRRPAFAVARAHAAVALPQAARPRDDGEGPGRPPDGVRRPAARNCRASSRSAASTSTPRGCCSLTNDGGLARVLGHPSTGWLRRYRVRAYGDVDTEKLESAGQRHRDRRLQLRPDRG